MLAATASRGWEAYPNLRLPRPRLSAAVDCSDGSVSGSDAASGACRTELQIASAADQRGLVRGDGASNPNFRAASGTPSDNSEREGRRLRLVLLLGLPLLIVPHDFICLFLPFRGDGQDQLTQERPFGFVFVRRNWRAPK